MHRDITIFRCTCRVWCLIKHRVTFSFALNVTDLLHLCNYISLHVYFQKYFPKVSVKSENSADVPKGRGRGRPSKRTKSKLVEEPGK
jgi:hypothetical protein